MAFDPNTLSGLKNFNEDVNFNNNVDVYGKFNSFRGADFHKTLKSFGDANFYSILNSNGQTNVNNLNVTGIVTFSNLNDLNITGISTFSILTTTQADINNLNVSGIGTFVNLNVTNQTDLNKLNVSGITTCSGTLDLQSSAEVKEIFEKVVVKSSALTGTTNINVYEGSLVNFTTDATGDFAFNFEGGSIDFNSTMSVGQSLTMSLLCQMGSTAYVIQSSDQVEIEGTSQTVKWIGGSSPTSGYINSINAYTFVIIKNGSNDYTVLGSLSRFS